MIYLRYFVLVLCIAFTCSCATIWNSRTAPIHILLSESSTVSIDRDTIAVMQTAVDYRVPRKKPEILLRASNGDSVAKEFYLYHKPSILTWVNIISPSSLVGLLVDGMTHRGMTYPHTVYIDFDDAENVYLKYRPQDDAKQNFVKLTPFKIAGVVNPAVELTYERVLTNRMSAQFKSGYLLPQGIGGGFPKNRKGFLLSLEPKFYLKEKAPYGLYFGLEGSHLKSGYSNILFFELPALDDQDPNDYNYPETYPDSVSVHKRNSAINVKIGYQYVYRHWTVDFYFGVGAMYKNVWHTGRLYTEHTLFRPRHPNVWYYSEREQRRWAFNVPMNLAVGYRF